MISSPFIPGFELVLASESPRRRDILIQAGVPFLIRPSGIAEIRQADENAASYVARLAREKAASIVATPNQGILAADTTVVLSDAGNQRILEKPLDAVEAKAMLKSLQGRSHTVLTGLCFRYRDNDWHHVEHTQVSIAAMSHSDINSYVHSGEPFGKAGAYAIQGLASRHVTHIEGCYFNVVGLPIHRVFTLFDQAGVLAKA